MSKKVSVQVIENGPLKVSNVESIKFCGKKLEKKGEMYLCRCGESKNAPFCDGAHVKAGFKGEKEVQEEQGIRTWEGKTIRTFFNANICMHAGYCRPLNALREKELSGDKSAASEIARVVTLCPSGALSFEMIGKDNSIQFQDSNEIEIVEGGEIRIQCGFEGVERQEKQPENRLTLCRCGLSKNKPFCDASHSEKKDFK